MIAFTFDLSPKVKLDLGFVTISLICRNRFQQYVCFHSMIVLYLYYYYYYYYYY